MLLLQLSVLLPALLSFLGLSPLQLLRRRLFDVRRVELIETLGLTSRKFIISAMCPPLEAAKVVTQHLVDFLADC